MARAFLSLLLAAAIAASGCATRTAARPPTVAPAVPLSATEELQHDLDAVFHSSSVAHAQWGVSVYSLTRRDPLYTYNDQRFLVPASNQKLLTTATAAERLTWDYRFTTRLVATAPIDADGMLNGDLVVVGNGDPTINPRHGARWRAFDDWAAALRSRGLRVIAGDLVGDDNAVDEPGWGTGWAWDNLQYGYGTPVGALQFNEDQVELQVGPGMTEGARAIVAVSPPGSGLVIENGVTTAASGTATSVEISRIPGLAVLELRGQIAIDAKPTTVTASVPNPTRFYVNALRDAFARYGITVARHAVDIDDLETAPGLAHASELLVDQSPPLAEIIDVALKWSRNGYAETLLRALSPPGKPAAESRGLDAMREVLASWGIAPEWYLPRDGSGLSRYDYVTADVLVRLLTHLADDPKHAQTFRSTLPEAGVSGTLADRLKGTPAESRIFAKTGTLSNVRALSGYLTTLAGEEIVFSILVNNFRVPATEIDALMDKALLRLIEFRRGLR